MIKEQEAFVDVKAKEEDLDPDYTFDRVPKSSRKGFISIFFIMLGFTFFSASMSVGAKLGNGLNLSGFLWSILIGGAILAIYTGLLAYISADTGLSFDLLARKSFGVKGSKLPSILIGFTQIGWFGVGLAMFAVPASEVLGVNKYILIAIAGILMTSSAYFGIKGMEIISYISVPLITILGCYSIFLALGDGGSLRDIFAKNQGSISLTMGIGLVIGSFVSGGTATPNFARFAKNKKIAVISTVIAFFIGNSLMFTFGAVGGAFTGKDDIFYVMIAQGLTLVAIIVLGANIWTTNDNALYTGALGLSNITGARKKKMVILSGIIGTVAALWLYENFVGWLTFLNGTLPPIGGILILDYFMNKKKYNEDSRDKNNVNYSAIVAVIVGAVIGNFIKFGIASLNAIFASCLVYFILEKNKENKERR